MNSSRHHLHNSRVADKRQVTCHKLFVDATYVCLFISTSLLLASSSSLFPIRSHLVFGAKLSAVVKTSFRSHITCRAKVVFTNLTLCSPPLLLPWIRSDNFTIREERWPTPLNLLSFRQTNIFLRIFSLQTTWASALRFAFSFSFSFSFSYFFPLFFSVFQSDWTRSDYSRFDLLLR